MVSVAELADRAENAVNGKERVLISLAGIPGSGKSTTAALVTDELNKRGIPAEVVGMDGFHYTRKELAKRIGEEKAIKYRGAPYTFDAAGVVDLARHLVRPGQPVKFPTFDHAVKDPVLDGGEVAPNTRVVILEGNYVHLDEPEWKDIMKLATDTWFVDVDKAVARARLAKRHVESGIVGNLAAGEARADSNDLVNGDYINAHSAPANLVINTTS